MILRPENQNHCKSYISDPQVNITLKGGGCASKVEKCTRAMLPQTANTVIVFNIGRASRPELVFVARRTPQLPMVSEKSSGAVLSWLHCGWIYIRADMMTNCGSQKNAYGMFCSSCSY